MTRRRPFLGVRHLLLFLTATRVWEASIAQTTTTNQTDDKNQEVKNSQWRKKKKRKSQFGMNRPSISSKSRAQRVSTAPLRSDGSIPVDFQSIRMQEYSLAHHASYLYQKNNSPNQQTSFQELLRIVEEEHKNRIIKSTNKQSPPPRISLKFISVVGSALLFALSAFVWDPSSAQSLWKTVLNKKLGAALAVAWLPWCWYHPAKLALLDLLILTQIIRQPAVLPYLQKEVLPILWKTLQTMIITEAWTRTWKWVFANAEQVRQFVIRKYNDGQLVKDQKNMDEDREEDSWKDGHLVWPGPEPPSWLVQLHGAIVGSVQRGLKSAFKKSIQETVVSAFEVWKSALQEQIIVVAECGMDMNG